MYAFASAELCDSIRPERVKAVAQFGFTERQARFLVDVLLHSGVFLERQYCRSAGLTHGRKTYEFLRALTDRKYATVVMPGKLHSGRLYHVQYKPLYEAIGEPDNRNRRPVALGRLIERLMLLDVVLADDRHTWLATEKDKLAYFRARRCGTRRTVTSHCRAWPSARALAECTDTSLTSSLDYRLAVECSESPSRNGQCIASANIVPTVDFPEPATPITTTIIDGPASSGLLHAPLDGWRPAAREVERAVDQPHVRERLGSFPNVGAASMLLEVLIHSRLQEASQSWGRHHKDSSTEPEDVMSDLNDRDWVLAGSCRGRAARRAAAFLVFTSRGRQVLANINPALDDVSALLSEFRRALRRARRWRTKRVPRPMT
jgi:hypothetical protein